MALACTDSYDSHPWERDGLTLRCPECGTVDLSGTRVVRGLWRLWRVGVRVWLVVLLTGLVVAISR